ncbi:hypothetical protein BTHERMOSOX_1027 [Bathymodiolus thermophilus thioautotrophic gill symbiont]|uniref:Uncharacterized protein n=1 Tax=Bathymodiolus thermophilus thioautotrophic gill symbiont TaxID=2360 RepID=A0A8H8XB20_9GAMM|nr:hypothetical protein [Bathymodiolus thermophilus thioautotrophic gill symbiont]CAB5495613.1 hypothetical protein THERMOS_323 [Bathymodiolus thermophilus thioautotrophic gill symbiont]CAB5499722.1 hypothetical protein THERMOT_1110 [Bathymodiolus thermophilus thioautotrophic gill symbiont]SHA29405.1 hypothetical protein BTHERMOSOX_1027 [Bathymodiolus thermophilus thioautotrophic gill symbiont]
MGNDQSLIFPNWQFLQILSWQNQDWVWGVSKGLVVLFFNLCTIRL